MEIEVNVNLERVIIIKEIVNVELPTESKFYKMNDDGNFFPRGIVLMAIVFNYKNHYSLILQVFVMI